MINFNENVISQIDMYRSQFAFQFTLLQYINMSNSGLTWGQKFNIFKKRKGQKRNRQHIMKTNAQGILLK